MDYKATASEILKLIGGERNVTHFEHCSTRLRFTLADNKRADIEALKQVPGVMGVVMASQCQVIIGNQVVEVFDEIMKMASFSDHPAGDGEKQKMSIGETVMDFVIGVFQPVVPAIAGGGVLKAMLSLLVLIGVMDKTGTAYQIFNNIGDAALYFLPLLVAVSAAKKLKCNQMVALAAVGALLLPNISSMLTAEGGTVFLGFTLQNIAYSYQIFPALLTVLLLSIVEKLFTKISPKPIRIFFVPMMCFMIVVPCTLLILGPLGYNIGTILTNIILFMHSKLGFVAIGVLAMLLPFCVATGMHKAFLPYAISTYSALGYEFLYLPASLAHNIAESGACFAVVLRTKSKERRSTAISAGISALFGITEPALYGITLQNKRVLGGVMIGSGIAGIVAGIFSVAGYAIVGPGLAGMAMFVDPDGVNVNNIMYAFLAFGVAFLGAMAATFVLYKDEDQVPADQKADIPTPVAAMTETDGIVLSPLAGQVIPLESVKDEVFANKIIGDGVAVIPQSGILKTPGSGMITMVADSKHAIGITLDNGTQILLHVGLDTVQLDGKYFDVNVVVGDKVKAGDVLLVFDLDKMRAEGYDLVTPVIIANGSRYQVNDAKMGTIRVGEALFTAKKVEES
ncbi:MAG: beta-glucoside-specific PTS transporter subunit IIABC [Lachnospiraceae bacterium]